MIGIDCIFKLCVSSRILLVVFSKACFHTFLKSLYLPVALNNRLNPVLALWKFLLNLKGS